MSNSALRRPDIDDDLDRRAPAQRGPTLSAVDCERRDYFVPVEGGEAAGRHLLVDFWGARGIDDLAVMRHALTDAAERSGASLLHVHLHHFTPNDGISGVALLAESHISVHTWPERSFAAFDIFMCGATAPEKAVELLEERFAPTEVVVKEIWRGRTRGDD